MWRQHNCVSFCLSLSVCGIISTTKLLSFREIQCKGFFLNKKLASRFELHENRHSDSCTLLKVVHFYPELPYFCTDRMKFSMKDFSIVLLSSYEFCENLC